MMGLAEDGGLLLPRTIPRIGNDTFQSWQDLAYPELAYEVMSRFIDDIPSSDLKEIIDSSYTSFTDENITPLVHHGNLHILELFHGPTLAFKDIALQFLGNLFEYLLGQSNSVLNILGATSGDTGSAAIYGVRGKERINIFILHPHQRVSPVQEKQMTTVLDPNVFNIAIRGSFDDGQAIVKSIFNDIDFKNNFHLGSINSINWVRIVAQVVYYIYSCLHMTSHEKTGSVDFSVPTGNFGDIFAGFIARRMLPEGTIRHLILATNDNDILSRMVNEGDYSLGDVSITSSPSMDIQAASNFERYLYYLLDGDSEKTADYMQKFSSDNVLDLSNYKDQIKRDFLAVAVTESEVFETIKTFSETHGYTLDPHTGVGVAAAKHCGSGAIPIVCLATAHPAKFSEVVEEAIGSPPTSPTPLEGILEKPSRCETMEADTKLIKNFIEQNGLRL